MLLSVVDCGAVGLPLFPPLGAGDDGEIVVRIVLLEDDLEIVQCTVPFISRINIFFCVKITVAPLDASARQGSFSFSQGSF